MKRILFPLFVLALTQWSLQALEPGSKAPNFTLTSVDGKTVHLSDYAGKTVVLEWFNMGCPFVKKHYNGKNMQKLQEEYTSKGVVWLTINSTHSSHTDYLPPDKASEQAAKIGIKCTSLLLDTDGKVGREYQAKSTPHMFVIDASGTLVYQGAIDDQPSPKANPAEAHNYVRQALDEVLAGKPVSVPSTKQYGCSVKYSE